MDYRCTPSEQLEYAKNLYFQYAEKNDAASIGRLSEKSLHGILKFYFDPDSTHHEVVLQQGCVADIYDGEAVTEIQTGSYSALSKKLPKLLGTYSVHTVCPIVENQYIYYVDSQNGDVQGGRKSPRHRTKSCALEAMVYLDAFLDTPGFFLTFITLDTAEYRSLDQKNRRGKSLKLDRVPLVIHRVFSVTSREDYRQLLPPGLNDRFTAAEFLKKSKVKNRYVSAVLRILQNAGIIKRCPSDTRAYLYTVCAPKTNCIDMI